ncbi:MAG: hypothetical protein KQJ78_06910 [Deltaproteobacteria bacterium]|nr:hypothetical protein [Deltaproteobacteria bacterium]
MKKSLVTLVIVLGLALVPVMAMAGTWDGTIQGLQCATEGKVCPVDMEDPLAQVEKDFVLVTKDGWYTLPNLSRALLSRFINKSVTVEGAKSPKYNAINVTALKSDGKVVWNAAIQQKLMDKMEWNY